MRLCLPGARAPSHCAGDAQGFFPLAPVKQQRGAIESQDVALGIVLQTLIQYR